MTRRPIIKNETRFRTSKVDPFLKTLKNTFSESIQQVSINGSADKHLCIRGKFVALELKAKGGKVSGLQRFKLNEVNRCGGYALVADPDNWEEIKQLLSKLDKGEL